MNRQTQGLLMAFLGAVLLRLALSDAYLRYVTSWMKWPIAASGVLLLLLALGPILQRAEDDDSNAGGAGDGHEHPVPAVTWLLVLPGLVVFVISPPELGSYLAERRSGDAVAVAQPAELAALDSSTRAALPLSEFIWRAQDGGTTLEGQEVVLKGFASYDKDGKWFVTRMTIGCCAADALAFRVQVAEAERPARDQWVEVTGTHLAGTGTDPRKALPVLSASQVREVKAPRQPYE